jgi:GNAT superfamily N-acetyltransferase
MYWHRCGRDGLSSVMLSPTTDEKLWLLNRVITTAKYRGQGYARKTMADCLMDADIEGVTLLLQVIGEGRDEDPDDELLIAWYGRLGFEMVLPDELVMRRWPV